MPANLPPGPRYPGVFTLYLTQRHTKAFLESASRRYGEMFTVRLIRGKTLVFVSNPALIESVFSAASDVLIGDRGVEIIVGKNSVLAVSGPAHTAARELLSPAFRGDHVQRYRDVMARVCSEEVSGWPLGQPLELLPRLEKITLGVIKSGIFGENPGASVDALDAQFSEMLAYRDKPIAVAMMNVTRPGSDPPKSFLRLRDPFYAAVLAEIERTRKDPRLGEREDILAMLVQAQHDDGSPLTDDEIRDHIVTLLLQGHQSTAIALAWALERLARHPNILERLRSEVEAGSEDYLDAVVKETLRLRPPVPLIVREVAKPFRLGEYELEPGRLIACNGFALHLREDLYPEPLRFRPERFLDEKPGTDTWIPFGGGVRHCIGRSLATYEIKYILTTLVKRFRFATVKQKDEGTRRRGIQWMPKEGAKLVLEEP